MKVYPIFKKENRNKIEMLLEATNKRNYVLWLVGTQTGYRVSDIVGLRVKDVKGSAITLKEQKTGKDRTVKINKKLRTALKDYTKTMKDDDYLFPSRLGGGNRHICIRRVQQIIKKVAELCGIEENINSHSMRKTFAYLIYKSTGSLALVMESLNHSKESITIRYLCLSHLMINDATEALADM